MSSPIPPKTQIWSAAFDGGEPKLLGDAEAPVISPQSDRVLFEKDRTIWVVPINGSQPAKRLFSTVRGENGDAQWSPDGARVAFVGNRGDHSFIGVYSNDSTPILWIAPST
jgi:Tol biopolymer transport system component